MISQSMQNALNAQINAEQFSSQLYLAMSAHAEGKSFRGFASWLKVQAQEESLHAHKLIDFLLDRGGKLELQAVSAPPKEFGNIIEIFENVLAHEKGITQKINALFAQAREEKDYASELALQWFVTEQVEEESNVSQILDHLKAVGMTGNGIWYMDGKMGKRAAE